MTLRTPPRPEGGLSMLEALIALAVLVWASVAALGVYEEMWGTFKTGENAAEQQQSVRLAFDKLVLDLQVSGFNHNPDGDPLRPDEQIEAAFDTAIAIRADFDDQYAGTRSTPESSLAGGAFDVVSIGNDEIVVYALAKADGSSSDTLTFSADVEEVPRDGVVETVSIPNLALVQDDPPYVLYRITLNNDASTWGQASFIRREVLAENVMSMTFRYLDYGGNALNPTFDLTDTSDDIGGAETAAPKLDRSLVRRIELSVVGLSKDPDPDWRDASDPHPATQALRKLELGADVKLRNAGLTGQRDLSAS